ncbi:MAG TPA: GNAT family N-acetyltransferase [Steroidobacteraceae bacterium]|nr:GNAT family N-acetyltransferase [Steroidobacteraceae bacterium]
MKTPQIRDAKLSDVSGTLTIYNDVLATSTSIFSDIKRTPDDQSKWFEDRRAQGWPVLVACSDSEVIGYASYGPFRSWPGYRHTVENSIYLAPSARGQGLGTQLLSALLERAEEQRLHAVIAGIDGDNVGSMRLHEKLGFTKVAQLKEVGRKFDRWLDLVFYQRLLSS